MNERSVKVLLVTYDPADARIIRERLSQVEDVVFQVEWFSRLSDGLKRLADGDVQAILLDLSLPDSQGLETFTRAHSQAPDVPIIVLTGAGDDELALRAISAGAEDYFVKRHVSSLSMARCIRHAIERNKAKARNRGGARNGETGTALGFVGAKGGVGTTTIALNVAATLAQSNAKVIALELPACYTSFSYYLRQNPARNLSSLLKLDAGQIDGPALASRLVELPLGLHVLFGPQRIEDFQGIGPEQAEALIRTAVRQADYVVVDLPPPPLSSSQAAVRNCDFVAMVVDREPACLMSAKLTAAHLRSWGLDQTALGAVVVNRTPLVSSLSLDEARSQVGCDIVGVIPHDAEICAASHKLGIPVALAYPANVVAQSLAELGKRFAQHNKTVEAVPM